MELITGKEVASFLNKSLQGDNISIKGYNAITEVQDNEITFAARMSNKMLELLQNNNQILAIVAPEYANLITCPHIISLTPRLDYIKVIRHFFVGLQKKTGISPTAIIEQGATIGRNVFIGDYCHIDSGVVIGDNTEIHHNVVICGKVNIGCNCYIKSGAVIGEEGFGFEIDENGIPLHFPHTGSVEIGNDVFIGANTTIERGTIGVTRIEDHVKIDDKVQIGHNTLTGANTLITVGAVLCGGVCVEKNSYIGPNVVIKEKLVVGKNAFIGMGAVVIHDVEPNTIVVGNPAKLLRKR